MPYFLLEQRTCSEIYLYAYCCDTFTIDSYKYIASTTQPVSPHALLAPQQVGCVSVMRWGEWEEDMEATPVKERSCSSGSLRQPVTNTHISHLLLAQLQLGLLVCVWKHIHVLVHTCAINLPCAHIHLRNGSVLYEEVYLFFVSCIPYF